MLQLQHLISSWAKSTNLVQTPRKSAPVGRRPWPRWAAPQTGGETERCLCSRWQEVRQRESKDGEQKLARENPAGGRFGAKRDGKSGQTVRCFRFQEDFWLRLWSVRAGAKFNWMSLELQGRTGAAVTVLPHRTGFSVPTEFSSHTLQAMDGRRGVNRAESRPCKRIEVMVVTPDPQPPTPPV